MSLSFTLGSMGFIARFITAFIIIAFLYSRGKSDRHIKKGFVVLVVLGVIAIFVGIVFFIGFFAVNGASFLGNALHNFNYYQHF